MIFAPLGKFVKYIAYDIILINMAGERIGNKDLQELYEKNGVSWRTEKDETGWNIIRVTFPSTEALPIKELKCTKCGCLVKTTLEPEEWPLPKHGVTVRFGNVRKYEVEGCAYDKAMEHWRDTQKPGHWDEIDLDEILKIDEECILSNIPTYTEQHTIIGKTVTFVLRRMDQKGICMRSPSVAAVKSVLGLK